jgi:hypothetical protein
MHKEISSTDAKSVITEIRRTAVKNKRFMWVALLSDHPAEMVNISSLSDCIMTIMDHMCILQELGHKQLLFFHKT